VSASTDIPAPAAPDAAAPPPAQAAKPGARRAVSLILRTSILLQILNSVSGIILARGLGVHSRGALAAAMLWPTIAGTLGTLGIEESMTYHIAREPDKSGRLLGSGLALIAIQSVVFAAIALAIIPIVLSKQSSSVVVSALLYTLYVPMYMTSVMLNAVLNGLHRYSWFNLVLIVLGVAVIVVQSVLLALGALSVRALIIAYDVMYVSMTVWIAWLVYRAGVRGLRSDRRTMRRLFSYGIRSHASTVPAQLNFSLDQLVISVFLTTAQLGVYVIAVTSSSLTNLIGASVAKAALPNVARLEPGPERSLLARRLVSATVLLSAAASLPVIVLAPQLITLFFGHPYAVGANIARILLVGAVALSTNRALEAVLRGVGRPLDAGVAEFVALGATAIGLAALLPTLGLVGAAWASLFAYVVSMVYMLARVTRSLEIGPMAVLTPDQEIVTAVLARIRLRNRA
jgi:O-antigen/teichoic acid export membrane protein